MNIKKMALLLSVIMLISCRSYDVFLLNHLEDSEKSKIITEKGIDKYQELIDQNQDFNAIDEVKEYFKVALQLDRTNNTAKEYIKKIDSLTQYFFNKMYKTALRYFEKRNKTEIDEYNVCYYIERALEIDPSNTEGLKFKKNNKALYDKIIKKYFAEGDVIKDKLKKGADNKVKDKLIISGFDLYNYILLIDKGDASAKKEQAYFTTSISASTAAKIKELDTALKAGKFDIVYNSLKDLDSNNKRLNNKFIREISDLKFRLYYFWAIDLFRKNKMQLSLYKINAALSIKKDNYLTNLKVTISEKLSSENFKNSFDSVIDDIDALIDKGSIDLAKTKIEGVLKSAKDNEQKKELEARAKIVKDKMPEIYDMAVSDYNNENFKASINKFQVIFKIDAGFRDVKSYLEKAIDKQKMFESH